MQRVAILAFAVTLCLGLFLTVLLAQPEESRTESQGESCRPKPVQSRQLPEAHRSPA